MDESYEGWSDWIVRDDADDTMPVVLIGLDGNDFEVMTPSSSLPCGGEYVDDWGHPDAGRWSIISYRYKISALARQLCFPKENVAEEEAPTSGGAALRFNTGKPKLSYVLDSMPALKDMVAVMEFGAEKYDRNNWKKGFPKEELLDSMLRHVDAFYSGEDTDPDSGEPHVGHILCNAMFLAYHYGSNSEYWKEKYNEE